MGAESRIYAHADADIARLICDGPQSSEIGKVVSTFDLGRDFHILHYLISGRVDADDSAATLILAGPQLAECSDHCGLHTADRINAFYLVLNALSPDDLVRRIDANMMLANNVYHAEFAADKTGPDGIRQRYLDLRCFIAKCVDNGLGAIVTVC